MNIQQALERLMSKADLSSDEMSAVMQQVMTGDATPVSDRWLSGRVTHEG